MRPLTGVVLGEASTDTLRVLEELVGTVLDTGRLLWSISMSFTELWRRHVGVTDAQGARSSPTTPLRTRRTRIAKETHVQTSAVEQHQCALIRGHSLSEGDGENMGEARRRHTSLVVRAFEVKSWAQALKHFSTRPE